MIVTWPRNALIHLYAIIATSVFLLTGCSEPAPNPIIIGVLLDMPTPGGPPSRNAAMLAAKEVNDVGGLQVLLDSSIKNTKLGRRPVKLVFEDTQNSPVGAMSAMRRLVGTENLIAVIGPSVSRNTIAAASIAETNQIPMISPGSTHPDTTRNKRFVFRVPYTDPVQGSLLSKFTLQQLGINKVAVLFDISRPSSRSVAETFKRDFESANGLITGYVSYVTGDTDFGQLVENALSNNPQAILLPNPSSDTLLQAKVMKSISPNTKLLGIDSWSPGKIQEEPVLEGAFYTHHWHSSSSELNLESRNFVAAYNKEYKATPAAMAALTYDAFSILFSSIERGGTESNNLRDAISNTDFKHGITGRITYKNGGDPEKSPIILTVRNQQSKVHPYFSDQPDKIQTEKSLSSFAP